MRQNFATQDAARAFRLRLENEAAGFVNSLSFQQTRLTPGQVRDAEAAIALLGHLPTTLVDAVEAVLSDRRNGLAPIMVEDGCHKFLEEKRSDGIREDALKDYKSRIGMLARRCEGMNIHEVKPDELRSLTNAWLREQGVPDMRAKWVELHYPVPQGRGV